MMEAIKTVLWGAAGIRRKAEAEKPIKPVHIILTAIGFVILFIVTLVTIVRVVTS
jgi:hypothetical protein